MLCLFSLHYHFTMSLWTSARCFTVPIQRFVCRSFFVFGLWFLLHFSGICRTWPFWPSYCVGTSSVLCRGSHFFILHLRHSSVKSFGGSSPRSRQVRSCLLWILRRMYHPSRYFSAFSLYHPSGMAKSSLSHRLYREYCVWVMRSILREWHSSSLAILHFSSCAMTLWPPVLHRAFRYALQCQSFLQAGKESG